MAKVWRSWAVAGALLASLVVAPAAFADGTETLGPPSVPIAPGTDIKVAGVGMHGFPDTATSFNADVPSNAIVKQVLAYWTGHVTSGSGPDQPDTQITLNGNNVSAQSLIGGPTNFFLGENFYTFRSDITNLNLIHPGSNVVTVSNLDFPSTFSPPSGNDGVGLVIVYDDGTPSTTAGIVDGQDLAYYQFAAPLDATVPQTFHFTASSSSRNGLLGVLAGSVRGEDLDVQRGNVIRGQFDTGQTFTLTNPLQSNQGFEFDAANLPITIPAGASSVTVQLFSEGGERPASMNWITGTLMMDEPPPPPPGGQGCTPGYWKNHTSAWVPTGYSPSQALSTVFSPTGLGTLGSDSLLDALKYKGGSTLTAKKQILLRAAVASLLNAAHSGVSFGSTPAQIISAVNAALEGNDADTILALATDLDDRNNAGCPLN